MRGLRAALLPLAFLALSLDGRPATTPLRAEAPGSWPLLAATLPGRNEGRFGHAGDPLNLLVLGDDAAVRRALTAAGWTEIPFATRASLAAGLAEAVAGRTVASFPPMNEYRLRGRVQDMNWALPTRFLSARHHFRLWDSGLRDARGRAVWWGSANRDLSIRWRDLSHVPDPDADAERDFVAGTLGGAVELRALAAIPRDGANDKGYRFFDDGRAAVIDPERAAAK